MANEYFVNSADLTSIANAIRTKNKTSGTIAFPTGFVSAINNMSDEKVYTEQLYNALQYSGFATSSMSFSDMCAALLVAHPQTRNFINTTLTDWSISQSMAQLTAPTVTITDSTISFKTYKMNAQSGYVEFLSPTFTPKSGSKLNYVGNFSTEKQAYEGHIYILANGTYTQVGKYGVKNTAFSNSIDLSSYADKLCQIVIREYCGWNVSNTDWTLMTFSTLEVTM